MRAVFAAVGTVFLLLLATSGIGSPITPFVTPAPEVGPLASQIYTVEFKGQQRACAIAIGNGNTYMGLYIYDIYGNCVAWDDEGMPQTCDDLAVEWWPRQDAAYVIELHNNGLLSNKCKVTIR
jgi:hypothetical protein